jgi:hypothetical protein
MLNETYVCVAVAVSPVLLALVTAGLLPSDLADGREAAAEPATVVDDFSDGDFTCNPPWTVQSGSFAVRNEELAFGTEKDPIIHLDLGKVAWKTPLKARLKLRQTNASGQTSFLFGLALTETGSGRTHEISASPHPGYFGTSSFYDGATVGVKDAMLNGDTTPQTLEIALDPAANSVTLRKDGVEVFRGPNRMEMSRVNRLTLKSGGPLWKEQTRSDDVSPTNRVKIRTCPSPWPLAWLLACAMTMPIMEDEPCAKEKTGQAAAPSSMRLPSCRAPGGNR